MQQALGRLGDKRVSCVCQWGNVCPARARHATFLLTIPTSAPCPLMEKAPQIDHDGLRTFPTKHVA